MYLREGRAAWWFVGWSAHTAAGGGRRSHPPPRALGGRHTALAGMLGGIALPGGGQRHAGGRGRGPQPAARGGAPTCLECNTAALAGLAVRSWTVKREKNRADAAARGAAAAQSMIERAPDPYVPCNVREGRWQGRGGVPHARCCGVLGNSRQRADSLLLRPCHRQLQSPHIHC